ncbi:class I SAM-dependent methyltransferase [Candidatus Woesearchaeota archaeon]|jgi:ubiquinone/menaquinone biosynthesis C-methylase UbiE|nr:class I SAM-dependent methyltransferase [Candidatus Woesearchaeota archaeon]
MKDYEKQLYEKVGSNIGWDFNEIFKRVKTIDKKWNFLEIVKNHLKKKTILLDIGTGGGEKLLQIAKFVEKAYGIDISKGMITTAKKNLVKSNLSNVEFKLADANKLPFPKNYFDIITCKHAPFSTKELFRVLKPNGIFITQQVGERDKQNIKDIFERGQCFEEKDNTSMNKYIQKLKQFKFKIIKKEIYNATQYFHNMKDIIFLLKNTPIIPHFDIEKDKKFLEEFEKKYKTKKGIKTNSNRYLIISKKSA